MLWRAFSCANAFVRFAVIRHSGFVSFSAVITFLTSIATSTTAPAEIGIAARYHGDKDIASDPAVILFDDFEGYTSPSQLTSKWTSAYRLPNLRLATEQGNYYADGKSLEMTLPVSTTEISNACTKTLATTQDTVFIRTYTKFDAGYSVSTSNHNGLRLSAKYPGAGIKAPWYSDGFVVPPGSTGNQGEWLAYPKPVSRLQATTQLATGTREMVLLRTDGKSEHAGRQRRRGQILDRRQSSGRLS